MLIDECNYFFPKMFQKQFQLATSSIDPRRNQEARLEVANQNHGDNHSNDDENRSLRRSSDL